MPRCQAIGCTREAKVHWCGRHAELVPLRVEQRLAEEDWRCARLRKMTPRWLLWMRAAQGCIAKIEGRDMPKQVVEASVLAAKVLEKTGGRARMRKDGSLIVTFEPPKTV